MTENFEVIKTNKAIRDLSDALDDEFKYFSPMPSRSGGDAELVSRSAAKWVAVKKIIQLLDVVTGKYHCPLCQMYIEKEDCGSCPIAEYHGEACHKTPYRDFKTALSDAEELAGDEIQMLTRLI